MAGLFSRALERRTPDQRDAKELRDGSAEAGCGLISSCTNRALVTIHGELRWVSMRPVDGVPSLEAEIYDGSDAVTLVWMGRRRIEGIRAGKRLTAHGRIGRRGTERIIYNPRYELDA